MQQETIIVLGAGQSGGWAAMTLRSEGFAGRIILVGEEPHLPYERPPLSKGVLAGTQDTATTAIFADKIFGEKRIEHVVGRAASIDVRGRAVHLEDGSAHAFDRLIIATGARVRKLSCAGSDLGGIHYLRNIEDALALRRSLKRASRMLVIGGGWIGLEAAATAREMGVEVVLVEAADRLCPRTLPPQVADRIAAMHRDHRVDIRIGTSVVAFEGDGVVTGARLAEGTVVSADCVLVGIGIVPNDGIAAAAGIATDDGILVDDFARTSQPGIFATGDVARQPNGHLPGAVRLETWENAQNQGVHAARSLLGTAPVGYDPVPWVWSDQYGVNIQAVGFPPEPIDEIVCLPDETTSDPVFAFLRGDRLRGAVGFNRGRDVKVLRRLMEAGCVVNQDVLRLKPNEQMKLARQAEPAAG